MIKNRARVAFAVWGVAMIILGYTILLEHTANTVKADRGFTGIQDAIDHASVGDVIIVPADTYYENVYINKRITLKGNNSNGRMPVIDAKNADSGISITANGVHVEGFRIINSKVTYAGIYVSSGDNVIIGNEVVHNNGYGIYLFNTDNNSIINNIVSYNSEHGIDLESSDHNRIVNNTANDSEGGSGIYLYKSYFNELRGNSANNNPQALGIYLQDSDNNIVTGNLVTGNDDGLWISSSSYNDVNNNTASYNVAYGIKVYYDSTHNVVKDNIAEHNPGIGIRLVDARYNDVFRNKCMFNGGSGIRIQTSSFNDIRDNTASQNKYYGILITNSFEVPSFHNSTGSFFNNVIRNNVTNNNCGICIESDSDSNVIDWNYIAHNYDGITIKPSADGNKVRYNKIENNDYAITIDGSEKNEVIGNLIGNNNHDIEVNNSRNNTIIDNKIVAMALQLMAILMLLIDNSY